MANENRTISNLGIDLIKHFESFRAKSYKDSAGVWTIGYGTIIIGGVPVGPNMMCTEAQAIEWMAHDVVKKERHVHRLTKVDLPQHQFDALVSFTYNVGEGALAQSTLLKRINARLPVEEARFTDWNKARVNGVLKPLGGLTRRRKAEYHLFTTGSLRFHF